VSKHRHYVISMRNTKTYWVLLGVTVVANCHGSHGWALLALLGALSVLVWSVDVRNTHNTDSEDP
jgi:hypothetical protein